MSKWTQQMPLVIEVESVSLLTDEQVKQINGYIEQGNALDVVIKEQSGEEMAVIGCIPEVKNAQGEVVSTAYIEVVKNGSIVKAGVTENLPAPTIKGDSTFTDKVAVTIEAREGCDIYYTNDGSTPTSGSTAYSEALTLEATTTIKAIAVKGGITSEVASKTFTKNA